MPFPQGTRPVTAPARSSAAPYTAETPGTDFLFATYLAVVFIEYLGLASVIPPLQASRLPTLMAWGLSITMMIRIGGRAFVEFPQSKLLLAMMIFAGISVPIAFVQTTAFTAFRGFVDYFGFFVTTLYLVDRPKRIDRLVLTFSGIAVIAVARNIDKLTAAVRQGTMNGAYFTGDGNDFGWFLCTVLPLALYPIIGKRSMLLRVVGAGGVVICLLGAVGTQSRGATLALAAATVYYWAKVTRRKILALGMVVLLGIAVLAVAPPEYFDRLRTLENVSEDGSATSRLKMWGIAMHMAVDYPLGVGAGNFSAAYGMAYLPREAASNTWGAMRWLSPHSVYFRALGEHGILGLIMILSLIVINYRMNHRTVRLLRETPGSPLPEQWPALLNMSLVAYAVAGAFLGGLAYPHIYLLSALTASAVRIARAAASAAVVQTVPARTETLLERLVKGKPPARPIAPAAVAGVTRRAPVR